VSHLSFFFEQGNSKVASFDLDGTLIVPKNQTKYPSGPTDWKWLFPGVKTKLQQLHADGWKVVIFSNQAGIEKGRERLDHVTGKIIDISQELGFPLQAFIACAIDNNRKPHTTMWEIMVQNYNDKIEPDKSQCFFVGDAAGRPKDWKKGAKKDISCCDRAFALNIGIKFATPEAYFLGENEPTVFEWDGIDPTRLLHELEQKKVEEKEYANSSQEMVLLVGQPCAGKTTFAKRQFVSKGYVHVNRDTLGTMTKCLKVTEEAIKEGKSVVVDSTNPTVAARTFQGAFCEDCRQCSGTMFCAKHFT
jgi:bifunctional polynucleotide phosphatase/kinase